MSKIEKAVVALLFFAMFAVFQYANRVNYFYGQLDSAMMVGNVDSTYEKGAPISQINASAIKGIATVVVQDAREVCAQPLREDLVETIAMFERHAYGILYGLAPFRAIASSHAIVATFNAMAFVGLLLAIYLFLRNERLSIPATLLFGALVIAHPAWSESAFGQFYPDRFFIFVGFVYVMLLYRRLAGKADHTLAILLTAVLAASLTERAAIMTGGSTLALLVLFRGLRGWSRKDLLLIAVATAMLAYAMSYMLFVQHNPDYGSYSSQALSFFSDIANNEPFRSKLEKYLWVNLPYLILAAFEWRLALLAFGTMLPNIFGSIGGAEKMGWSTHYHSMYFPFLLAAASLGFLNICRLIEHGWQRRTVFTVMGLVAVYMAMISPFTLTPVWEFKRENIKNNAMLKVFGVLTNSGVGASIRMFADFNKAVAAAIPDGATVSAGEGMMPALSGKDRILHYYPLGIGSVDYVVLSFTRDDKGELSLFGATSYLGADNRAALDTCLNARIAKEFKLEKTISPGAATGYGAAIFKRIKKE